MKVSWQLVTIILVVVVCVTIIQLYALSKGMNGAMMMSCIGLLVGIPTYLITKRYTQKQNGKS